MARVTVEGWTAGARVVSAVRMLRASGLRLKAAQDVVDQVLGGQTVEFEVTPQNEARRTIAELNRLGFRARFSSAGPIGSGRPDRGPDLEALVTLVPIARGGRGHPVPSGFLFSHDFGLPEEINDARHEYPDVSWVYPGDSARALLWLLAPDRQQGRLHRGLQFTVNEGGRQIGRGEITKVPNSHLE